MSDSVWPHRRQPTRLPCPWDSPGKNTGVSCHFLLQCMKVKSESKVTQSCPTLSEPMDCSLPGSSVHGIFQARVLEWGAWWILSAREQRFQSCCYGKWPQGSSMSLLLVTGGTRTLGKVLFLDCQLESNVLEEICKVYVPYHLPSLPLCPGHILLPAPLCGKCFYHRWGDPKEGSWRWEHHHLETWSPGGLSKALPA